MANGNGDLGIKLSFGQWLSIAALLGAGGVGWGMLKADVDGIKKTLDALTVGQAAAVVQMRDMHDEVIGLKIGAEADRAKRR